MYIYEDIRLWEIHFEVMHPMPSMPVPHEIVLERQTSPSYYLCGKGRPADYTQIVCTLSGEGAFRYGQKTCKLLPGKAFICTLGDPKSAYYYPGHAQEPWIFLWMDFQGETAVRMLEELSGRYGHVVDIPVDSEFVKYLESFRTQRRSLRFVTATAGAKIVSDALAALGENLEINEISSKGSRLVQAAQTIINKDPERSFDLAGIAARLHVSREHLSRVFHAQTGMSLQKYSEKERMHLAVRMLRENLFSCSEIAARTGFGSPVSFARAFRKIYKCSPTQYRKENSESCTERKLQK